MYDYSRSCMKWKPIEQTYFNTRQKQLLLDKNAGLNLMVICADLRLLNVDAIVILMKTVESIEFDHDIP